MMRHRLGDHPNKRPRAPRSAVGAGVAVAMALLGCTGGTEQMPAAGPPGSGPPPATGLDAFRSGFYAFASPSTSCGMCHASVQAPFFASPDVQAAYTAAKAVVDFHNPTNSVFIVYAGNNHCGVATVCGPSSGSPAIVQQDCIQWAKAEISSGSGGGPAPLAYLTASMAIPPIFGFVKRYSVGFGATISSSRMALASGATPGLRFESAKRSTAVFPAVSVGSVEIGGIGTDAVR